MSKKTSPVVSLLQKTCIWYSGISLFILAINLLIDSQKKGVEPLNLLLIFPFALCMYLPSGGSPVMLLIAAMVYGITTLIVWLCTRRKIQKQVDSTPYISQFGKKS